MASARKRSRKSKLEVREDCNFEDEKLQKVFNDLEDNINVIDNIDNDLQLSIKVEVEQLDHFIEEDMLQATSSTPAPLPKRRKVKNKNKKSKKNLVIVYDTALKKPALLTRKAQIIVPQTSNKIGIITQNATETTSNAEKSQDPTDDKEKTNDVDTVIENRLKKITDRDIQLLQKHLRKERERKVRLFKEQHEMRKKNLEQQIRDIFTKQPLLFTSIRLETTDKQPNTTETSNKQEEALDKQENISEASEDRSEQVTFNELQETDKHQHILDKRNISVTLEEKEIIFDKEQEPLDKQALDEQEMADKHEILDRLRKTMDKQTELLDKVHDTLDGGEETIVNEEDTLVNEEEKIDNEEEIMENDEERVDNEEVTLDKPEETMDKPQETLDKTLNKQDETLDNQEQILDSEEKIFHEDQETLVKRQETLDTLNMNLKTLHKQDETINKQQNITDTTDLLDIQGTSNDEQLPSDKQKIKLDDDDSDVKQNTSDNELENKSTQLQTYVQPVKQPKNIDTEIDKLLTTIKKYKFTLEEGLIYYCKKNCLLMCIKNTDDDILKTAKTLSDISIDNFDGYINVYLRNTIGNYRFVMDDLDSQDIWLNIAFDAYSANQKDNIQVLTYLNTPLLYICYKCKQSWWHYHDFREHIKIHAGKKFIIQLLFRDDEYFVTANDTFVKNLVYYKADGDCPKCQLHFSYHKEKKGYYKCYNCNLLINTCAEMHYHIHNLCLSQVIKQPIRCKICSIFTHSKNSKDHATAMHMVRSDVPMPVIVKTCSSCNQRYVCHATHRCPKHNFTCYFCGVKFFSANSIEAHLKNNIKVNCSICKETMDSCMYIQHLTGHSEHFRMMYKCLLCRTESKLFFDKKSAIWHMHMKHRIVSPDFKCLRIVPMPVPKTFINNISILPQRLEIDKSMQKVKLTRVLSKGSILPDNDNSMQTDYANIVSNPTNKSSDNPKTYVNPTTLNDIPSEVSDSVAPLTAEPTAIFDPAIVTENPKKNIVKISEGNDKSDIVKEEDTSDKLDVFVDVSTQDKVKIEAQSAEANWTITNDRSAKTNDTSAKTSGISAINDKSVKVSDKVIKINSKNIIKPNNYENFLSNVFRASIKVKTENNLELEKILRKEILNSQIDTKDNIVIKTEPINDEEGIDKETAKRNKTKHSKSITIDGTIETDRVTEDETTDNEECQVIENDMEIIEIEDAEVKEEPTDFTEVEQLEFSDDESNYRTEMLELEDNDTIDSTSTINKKIKVEPIDNTEIEENEIVYEFDPDQIKNEYQADLDDGEYAIDPNMYYESIDTEDSNEHVACLTAPTNLFSVKNLTFKCNECDLKFMNIKKYIDHMVKRHEFEELICPVCGTQEDTDTKLFVHLNRHIRNNYVSDYAYSSAPAINEIDGPTHKRMLRCRTCNQSVNVNDKYAHWDIHIQKNELRDEQAVPLPAKVDVDSENKDRCLSPNSLTTAISRLTAQISRDRFCTLCSKDFTREVDYKRHIVEHLLRDAYAKKSKTSKLRCQICEADFKSPDTYKFHMRSHGSMPIYRCELCNKTFSDSSNFAKHKKIHSVACYTCDICKGKFHSKIGIIKHMEIHTTTKAPTIRCKDCDKVFYTNASLRRHNYTKHNPYRKFSCKICDTRFHSLKDKWDHDWIVHKERKVTADCPICEKRFRKVADVRLHVRTEHKLKLKIKTARVRDR